MKFKRITKNSITIFGGMVLVSIFLSLTPGNVLSYSDTTTHPDLTREIIDFYELSGGRKFTEEQKQWIIQGSIDEDAAPRWLNHFYDPVFERGLDTSMPFVNGYSSKNWGLYSKYQLAKLGQTGTAGVMIAGLSDPSSLPFVFSYEAGIERYARDKEKDAYITLGHILHLIEDLTVPEHTRNDAHPGGNLPSHYENWTKENSAGLTQNLGKRLFVKGDKPVIYADLESYFNNLATYTNTHFFSPRTINLEIYLKPKIVYEDGTFAYGKDENGELYDLARVLSDKDTKIYFLKDPQILQEYWLRLSRQAVINGAGVVQLFLNQATAARDAELAKQKGAQPLAKKSSFISQIINFFSSPEAPKNEPALTITSESAPAAPKITKLAVSKPAPAPAPVVTPTPPSAVSTLAPAPSPAPPAPQNQYPQSNPPMVYGNGGGGGNGGSVSPTTSGGGGSSSNTTQQNQTQNSTQENIEIPTFNADDLVINEIMYDLEGSDTSSGKSREWVEIYNNSGREITLTGGSSGWRFSDGSNHLLNEPAAQGSMAIPIGGYAILAGDAATFLIDHSGFGGTVIDTVMSLKNTSATLKISAPDGTVIDEVIYDSSWGANGNGKTLERKSTAGGSNDAANWGFSSVNGGTPGAANNWFIAATTTPETATTTLATATSSPSLLGLGTDVPATTTITTNTTWTLAGSPYRLFFDNLKRPTVAAGAILTMEPGVKIIPQSGGFTALEIQGTLNAAGTAGAPIIFTSKNDADNDTSTTPQKGDWLNIAFTQGAQVNMDYVEFRYGGQGITLPLHEMVNIVGATVNINHSKFENSQNTALHLTDSSGVIENSIFSDNNCGISVDSTNGVANTAYAGCFGIHTTGQILSSTALEIKNNQFIRNQLIGVEVRSGTAPIINSNIFTDNGYPIKIESSYPVITSSQLVNSTTSSNVLGGIAISGYTHFSQNYTLKKDLPYILESGGPDMVPYIDAGATLTIEPGAIFKSNFNIGQKPAFVVFGRLIASGTPDNLIVFTSLKDDSRGGDTNGDGGATTLQDQEKDWTYIGFKPGSGGNFANVSFYYGGYGASENITESYLLADFPVAIGTLDVQNIAVGLDSFVPQYSGNFNKINIYQMQRAGDVSLTFELKENNQTVAIAGPIDLRAIPDDSPTFDFEVTSLYASLIEERTYQLFVSATSSTDGLAIFGKAANEKPAMAIYGIRSVPNPNPALSIDAGATVVVQ